MMIMMLSQVLSLTYQKVIFAAMYFPRILLQKMKQFVQNSQEPNHKKGFRNLCVFAKEKSIKESEWIADCC